MWPVDHSRSPTGQLSKAGILRSGTIQSTVASFNHRSLGSVDDERIRSFGSKCDQSVESGAVHVNGALFSSFVPFGGIEPSGIGHERGIAGMRLFQRIKIMCVTG
jgi:hypothetical protein